MHKVKLQYYYYISLGTCIKELFQSYQYKCIPNDFKII